MVAGNPDRARASRYLTNMLEQTDGSFISSLTKRYRGVDVPQGYLVEVVLKRFRHLVQHGDAKFVAPVPSIDQAGHSLNVPPVFK